MRIRSNFFVSLDGKVSGPGRSARPAAAPGVHGRRLLRAAGVPRQLRGGCQWRQPVFVLTSSALPEGTPAEVSAALSAAELAELMSSAGVRGEVNLVGGPSTMQAFRAIDALAEVWLHVVPMILGGGCPLAAVGEDPLSLTLHATRAFPDGVVELGYSPASAPAPLPAQAARRRFGAGGGPESVTDLATLDDPFGDGWIVARAAGCRSETGCRSGRASLSRCRGRQSPRARPGPGRARAPRRAPHRPRGCGERRASAVARPRPAPARRSR